MTQSNAPIESEGVGRASASGARVLDSRTAVVFGAGGSIGAAVAREFAKAGARVFLTGRTKSNLESVAEQITANGGAVQTSMIDALDDAAVNQYIDGIVNQTGRIDIILDATGHSRKSTETERAQWSCRLKNS